MEIEVGGEKFSLEQSRLKSGATVYFVDLLEDDKLCQAIASQLILRMKEAGHLESRPVFVAPEVKAVPLAKNLADIAGTTFAIARKRYFDVSIGAINSVRSFSAGSHRFDYRFSERTARRLDGAKVVIVDDVVTTGATISAVRSLCEASGAAVLAQYAAFREGNILNTTQPDIETLLHIPLDEVPIEAESFEHLALSSEASLRTVYTAMSKQYFCYRTPITQFAIETGYAPFNPFMAFDFALHGLCKREDIIRANNTMLAKCDEIWHFGPVSDGSLAEVILAKRTGKPTRFFDVDKTWKPHEIDRSLVIFEEDRLVVPFRKLFERA